MSFKGRLIYTLCRGAFAANQYVSDRIRRYHNQYNIDKLRSPHIIENTKFGVFFLNLEKAEDQSIYANGNVEKHLEDIISAFIRPDTIVIDVGANAGFISVMMSEFLRRRGNKTGKIFAYEPNTYNFERLVRNIAANDAGDTILPICAAACEKRGSVGFHSVRADARWQGNHSLLRNEKIEGFLQGHVDVVTVEGVTLDDEIAARSDGLKTSLIKVDVEGAEHLSLKGAAKIIERDRPTIVCEFRPSRLRYLDISEEDFAPVMNQDYTAYAVLSDGSLEAIRLSDEIHREGPDRFTDVVFSPTRLF